jgi:hypothetical protein
MKLLRVGERGSERPAVLDGGGVRDLSGIVSDFGPAFFAAVLTRRRLAGAVLTRRRLDQAAS